MRALVLLAGLVVTGSQVAGQAGPPVFGAKVESVYVDAFVTRHGLAVAGLTASDFELKDNGVRQEVELVSTESVPILAVLAFDVSESVAGQKLLALREAGRAFLAGLKPQDAVALVAFSQEIEWLAGPTPERTAVLDALGRLKARGNTAAFDALYAAITLPASPARRLVVLFSDGEENLSWLDEQQIRAAADRSNALIEVVTVQAEHLVGCGYCPPGEAATIRVLREIAEATGGRMWEAESPARLTNAFASIADAMRQRYVLRFDTERGRRKGWHRVAVRLRRGKGEVRTRRGYWVPE